MKVLVIGSGGREHALVWKIAQSPRVSQIYCALGSDAIARQARCVPIPATDVAALADFARRESVDLTVVGPEAALCVGIVDAFQQAGLRIFGPSQRAAEIESSKIFAKRLMKKYDIPTARFEEFSDPDAALEYLQSAALPVWIKADGLAAGKGAVAGRTRDEAANAVRAMMQDAAFGDAGRRIVIEEALQGQEATIMAFVAGAEFLAMPPAQDHKRIFDDDQGPNTGGIGCYSPVPAVTAEVERQAAERIIGPTLKALTEEGRPYNGVLYAELMLTPEGPKVIEFNSRFGDPEAQVVLPRLSSDLVEVLSAVAEGRLDGVSCEWSSQPAACVVITSRGYPGEYEKGREIGGLDAADQIPEVVVFHAGTRREDGRWLTNGGRVLGVTGLGDTLPDALARAYQGVAAISFDGAHYRRDIGRKALAARPGA